MTATARSGLLDFTKGVLIVLVCVGHAIQFAVYRNTGFWSDPAFKSIYMFHMPLFMAIAGYLSFRGLTGSERRLRYVSSRAVSCLLPIVSWAILFQGTLAIASGTPLHELPHAILDEVTGGLWFLWALLGSIVLVSVAQASGSYGPGVAFVLLVATLLLPENGILPLFKYTFPFFLVGFFLASLDPRRLCGNRLPLLTVPLGLASYLCYANWSNDTYVYVSGMSLTLDNLGNVGFRWLAGLAVSAFSFLLIYYLYRALPSPARTPLQLAGRDSVYIYVMQGYVFFAAERIAERFFGTVAATAPGGFVAIAVGAGVAFCCWWAARMMASNPACAYLLFGKRAGRGRNPAQTSDRLAATTAA